jgi:LysM repeat protein
MNVIRRMIIFLIAIAITIGLMSTAYQPAAATVENPQNCTRWHTVQRGEYLVMIAKQYETSWRNLVEINRLTHPSLIFPQQKLCIFYTGFTSNPPTNIPVSSSTASLFASSVKEDQYVTLQGKNFSANSRYNVYLGKYQADPAESILVGTALMDKSGSFKGTYNIPKKLIDVQKIRMSITSPRGVTSSNWFINATSTGNTGGVGSPELSLSVKSIKKNAWVKIVTKDLPANVSFHVYLSKPDANLRKAVLVGTLRNSKGGQVEATFDIPESLHDQSKLELRAVNNALDMIAEVTFDNRTQR